MEARNYGMLVYRHNGIYYKIATDDEGATSWMEIFYRFAQSERIPWRDIPPDGCNPWLEPPPYDSWPQDRTPQVDAQAYHYWLQEKRHLCGAMADDLDAYARTLDRNLHGRSVPPKPFLRGSRVEYTYQDSVWQPLPGVRFKGNVIQWVYVLDFDRQVLTLNGHFHYPLHTNPDEWFQGIQSPYKELAESDGTTFMKRIMSPAEFRSLQPSPGTVNLDISAPVDYDLLSKYSTLSPRAVRHTWPIGLRHERFSEVHFARYIYRCFIRDVHEHLLVSVPEWSDAERVFHGLSYALLCLAAGSPGCLQFRQKFMGPCMTDDYLEVIDDDLVPEIFTGFHMPDSPPWSAPSGCFWFRGILVRLQIDMTSSDKVKAGIAALVTSEESMGAQDYSAVLLSLEHLVLLQVRPGKSVLHTQLLPLNDLGREFTGEEDFRSSPGTNHDTADDDNRDGFMSLARVLSSVESQSRAGYNGTGILPLELWAQVLGDADSSTRDACSRASSALNDECRRTRMFDDAVLADAVPGDDISSTVPALQTGDGSTAQYYRIDVRPAHMARFSLGDAYYHSRELPIFPFELATQAERDEEGHGLFDSSLWVPVIGERGRRALLWGAAFFFKDYYYDADMFELRG